jgi:hypothetical protein
VPWPCLQVLSCTCPHLCLFTYPLLRVFVGGYASGYSNVINVLSNSTYAQRLLFGLFIQILMSICRLTYQAALQLTVGRDSFAACSLGNIVLFGKKVVTNQRFCACSLGFSLSILSKEIYMFGLTIASILYLSMYGSSLILLCFISCFCIRLHIYISVYLCMYICIYVCLSGGGSPVTAAVELFATRCFRGTSQSGTSCNDCPAVCLLSSSSSSLSLSSMLSC